MMMNYKSLVSVVRLLDVAKDLVAREKFQSGGISPVTADMWIENFQELLPDLEQALKEAKEKEGL